MIPIQFSFLTVTWTLDHAIKVNPGGVNGPISIAVLRMHKDEFEAGLLDDMELDEHRMEVDAIKEYLRKFPGSYSTEDLPTPPSVV